MENRPYVTRQWSNHTEKVRVDPVFWILRKRGDSLMAVFLSVLVFGATVFSGEAYRSYRFRFKQVPMLSAPLSNAYVVLMLLTASPVIATMYCLRENVYPLRISKNLETGVSTVMLWAMASAGAFVVLAIASEIDLRRSRVRTPNMNETQKTEEEATA
jgi:hypothetical protein